MILQQQLTQLEGAGLITLAQVAPELAYLFRHGLIHQAAHGSLVRADRRRLHQLAGETLEALHPDQLDALAPELALHFAAAGDRERAVGYHRRAARLAQARYANTEAVQQLQAAWLLLAPEDPPAARAAVLEELGDAHALLGEPTPAMDRYQAALALCPAASTDLLARLHRKVIEALTAMSGSVPIEQLQAALRAAAPSLAAGPTLVNETAPHPETVRLLVALAQLHGRAPARFPGWEGSLEAAEAYAAQAVALAERLDLAEALSAALGVLAGVLYLRGRLRERLAAAERRLALGPRLDDPRERVSGLITVGAALADVGEYARASALLQQAERAAAAIHAATQRVYAARLQAQCAFGLDRWDEVLASMERCRSLAADLTPEQTGPLCYELALSAVVQALRGEAGPAAALRNESAAIMGRVSGAVETWGRTQYY